MRKILFSFVLSAAVLSAGAQDLDDVQKKISSGKYADAKQSIDKILADPKHASKPNPWFYKAKVYAALAQQDSAGTLGYDAAGQAFEAFRKYQELDPKNTLMLLEQNMGLFQLYDMYYNRGVADYNNKKYEVAFERLRNAMAVEDYVRAKDYDYNGFKFPALDTQLVNLTASAAYLAKKQEESIPYFQRLADARIAGDNYKEVYGLLAQHYMTKDPALAQKYLSAGRELYPNESDYWIGLEFGDPGEDKAARLAKYEQMLSKYPNNFALAMDYAIEQYNHTYSNDAKPADYKERQSRLDKALRQALTANPKSALANYVMSQHMYNQIFDLEDQRRAIKTNTPADAAKRKDLNTKLDAQYEEMFKYSEAAYNAYSAEKATLKGADKVNYRKVANQMVDYYSRKKMADKVAFYENENKNMK